jgi:ADP-heptose:LPS heptosyltransferase
MLNFNVPAGIGDISWIYSKIKHINEDISLHISEDNPKRSLDYVKLLPKIKEARYDEGNFHNIVDNSPPASTSLYKITAKAKIRKLNFACNRHLESGQRLETYIPELPTDFHYEINTTEEDKIFASETLKNTKHPIGIYTSSHHNISVWDGWRVNSWKEFIETLHWKYNFLTFVFLGAEYDKPFVEDLTGQIQFIPHINICGYTTIGQTIEIIRLLKYFISYPSGLPILSNVVKTPVYMFYPKHLEKVIYTWPDPETIQNKTYKGSFFTTPREVIKFIVEEYKLIRG